MSALTCGLCEVTAASVRCAECDLAVCAPCDAELHRPVKLRGHSRRPLTGAEEGGAAAAVQPSMCALCEANEAAVECAECAMRLCEAGGCDAQIHRPAAKQLHSRRPLGKAATAPTATPAALCSVCEAEAGTTDCDECAAVFCGSCDSAFHSPAKLRQHSRRQRSRTEAEAQPPPNNSAPPARQTLHLRPSTPATAETAAVQPVQLSLLGPMPGAAAAPSMPLSPRFNAATGPPLLAGLKGASLTSKNSSLSALLSAAAGGSSASSSASSSPASSSVAGGPSTLASLIRPTSSPLTTVAPGSLSSSLMSSPLGRRTTAPTPAAIVAPAATTTSVPSGIASAPRLLSPFHARLASSPTVNSQPATVAPATPRNHTPALAASALCSVCESSAASLECVDCSALFCAAAPAGQGCFEQMHKPAKMRQHQARAIQQQHNTAHREAETTTTQPPPSTPSAAVSAEAPLASTAPAPAPAADNICNVCEDVRATLHCQQCSTSFCAACDEAFHQPAKMRAHVRHSTTAAQPTTTTATANNNSDNTRDGTAVNTSTAPNSQPASRTSMSSSTASIDKPNILRPASTSLSAAATAPPSSSAPVPVTSAAAGGHRMSLAAAAAEGGAGLESFTSYSSIINRLASMETSIRQLDKDRAASQSTLQQTVEHIEQQMQATLQLAQQQQQHNQQRQERAQQASEDRDGSAAADSPKSVQMDESARAAVSPERDQLLHQVQESASVRAHLLHVHNAHSEHSMHGHRLTTDAVNLSPALLCCAVVSLLAQLISNQAINLSGSPQLASASSQSGLTAADSAVAEQSVVAVAVNRDAGVAVNVPVADVTRTALSADTGSHAPAATRSAPSAESAHVPLPPPAQVPSVYLPCVEPVPYRPVPPSSASVSLSSLDCLLAGIDFSALAASARSVPGGRAEYSLSARHTSEAATALFAQLRTQAHTASRWRRQQSAQWSEGTRAHDKRSASRAASSRSRDRSPSADRAERATSHTKSQADEESKQEMTVADNYTYSAQDDKRVRPVNKSSSKGGEKLRTRRFKPR